MKKRLKEFKVIESGWEWNKFWFVVKKEEIDKFEIRKGPPEKLKKYSIEFKRKNKKTYVEKGRLMVKIPRKDYVLKDFVKNRLKEEYIQKRIKKIKKLKIQ